MNKIKTQKKKSLYEHFDIPYDDVVIDDMSIDEWLDLKIPNNNIKGLVPTVSGWFLDVHDEEIIWERIVPENDTKTICPILICPDDQDYFCTTIVVEIENKNNSILWNRFGINKKYEFRKYHTLGEEVEWYTLNEVFEFDKKIYLEVFELIKENRKLET